MQGRPLKFILFEYAHFNWNICDMINPALCTTGYFWETVEVPRLSSSLNSDTIAEFYKILSKSIWITNYILKYFNYFCPLLRTSSTNYKILLAKVVEIQNTVRVFRFCQSINQSINIRLTNKRNKHISRLGIDTVTVTVLYMTSIFTRLTPGKLKEFCRSYADLSYSFSVYYSELPR